MKITTPAFYPSKPSSKLFKASTVTASPTTQPDDFRLQASKNNLMIKFGNTGSADKKTLPLTAHQFTLQHAVANKQIELLKQLAAHDMKRSLTDQEYQYYKVLADRVKHLQEIANTNANAEKEVITDKIIDTSKRYIQSKTDTKDEHYQSHKYQLKHLQEVAQANAKQKVVYRNAYNILMHVYNNKDEPHQPDKNNKPTAPVSYPITPDWKRFRPDGLQIL